MFHNDSNKPGCTCLSLLVIVVCYFSSDLRPKVIVLFKPVE